MTAPKTAPRVMIWVQHLMGIGHQRRAAAIACALAERGADVALVTGGAGAPGIEVDQVRVVALPAVRAVDASYRALVDMHGREVDDDWRAARRDMLLAAFADHAPHVLVTESWPFGRRLLRFELEPLVERARAARCRLVSSIRDVLQPPSKPSRARAAADRVLECYDAVLVHGDPAFVGLDASFPETERIGDRIRYTGYVAQGQGPAAPLRGGRGRDRGLCRGRSGGAPTRGHRIGGRSPRSSIDVADSRRAERRGRRPDRLAPVRAGERHRGAESCRFRLDSLPGAGLRLPGGLQHRHRPPGRRRAGGAGAVLRRR